MTDKVLDEWCGRFAQDYERRFTEHQTELERVTWSTPSYRLEFSSMLPDDKVIVVDRVIHAPESQAYKWIFMNNHVTNNTVQFAINHAIRKVHRFIDNYKA